MREMFDSSRKTWNVLPSERETSGVLWGVAGRMMRWLPVCSAVGTNLEVAFHDAHLPVATTFPFYRVVKVIYREVRCLWAVRSPVEMALLVLLPAAELEQPLPFVSAWLPLSLRLLGVSGSW